MEDTREHVFRQGVLEDVYKQLELVLIEDGHVGVIDVPRTSSSTKRYSPVQIRISLWICITFTRI